MLIDCDSCAVRGPGCSGCVMTVLLATGTDRADAEDTSWPDGPIDFDPAEAAALSVLADSGLVPPLRLVPLGMPGRRDGGAPEYHGSARPDRIHQADRRTG